MTVIEADELTAQVAALTVKVERAEDDIQQVLAELKALREIMSKAQGGWQVLMVVGSIVGSIAGTIGAAIVWAFDHISFR